MSEVDEISVIGADAAALLGLEERDLLKVVREGFPYSAYERLLALLNVPSRELTTALVISERTLRRRREDARFTAEESDRLLRLARIVALSIQVFEGDATRAAHWLTSAKARLDGESPLQRADTDLGAREVEDMLYTIEFTMPA